MNISNEIKVGCDYPALCQFYPVIKEYIIDLNKEYDDQFDDTYILNGLVLSKMDEDHLYNIYYISKANTQLKVINKIHIKNATTEWSFEQTNEDMNILIDKCDNVLDIDYFCRVN